MVSSKQIFRACCYIFAVIFYLPIISLCILSFNKSRIAGYPLRGFTLEWWKLFLSDPIALSAVKNSLVAASVTSVLATLLGLGLALVLGRRVFRGRSALLYSMVIPIAIAYIIIGASLFLLFRRFLNIPLNLSTLIIGHTVVALPYSTLVLTARLIGFDKSLEEAAYDLGATGFTVFKKIILPLIMPGIISSLYMCFITSLEDVVLAEFLAGPDETVPLFIYGRLRRFYGLPEAMALSTFMALLMLSLTAIYLTKAAVVRK